MRTVRALFFLTAWVFAIAGGHAVDNDARGVRELLLDPVDATRNARIVPLKIYLPDAPTSPTPVVLFSHGLGGSREGSTYLGRHWSKAGYVAVFMQHAGSDASVWRGESPRNRLAALEKAANGKAFLDRVYDVRFTLDTLARWNAEKGHPLYGRMNLARIGMSGHSFGAVTTQAVMGQRFGRNRTLADPRLDAFIPMSPSPGRAGRDPRESFAQIRKPVLCMTGTKDQSIIAKDTTPDKRLAVYAALPAGDKYQIVFDGAQHSAFSDRSLPGETRDARIHPAILRLTTAFWDAYLRDDPKAKAYLQSRATQDVLSPEDKWDWK